MYKQWASFTQACQVEDYEDLCNGLDTIEVDRGCYESLIRTAELLGYTPTQLLHETLKKWIELEITRSQNV